MFEADNKRTNAAAAAESAVHGFVDAELQNPAAKQALIWFEQWKHEGRKESFVARLLVRWFQQHLRCSKRAARLAMRYPPSDSSFEELIHSIVLFDLNRRGRHRGERK